MQWIVDELFVGNQLASGDIRTPDGTAHRPAQHPLADRRLLLEGRQHHAAATGARLDPRPLRQRGRHPRLGPDHRLHRPRQGRPPRHLRLRRRRPQGARRVRLEHRPDRPAAPRPLRGGADPEGRGGRQPRPGHRRVADALRGAHSRRHPRPRRQRPRRRAQVRGRRPRSPRSTSRSTAPSPSRRSVPWSRRRSPRRCAGCTRCGSPTRCSARRTPGWPGSPTEAERVRGRRKPAGADNPLLAAQALVSQADRRGPRCLAQARWSGSPRTPSTPSTARRRCRPRSGSTPPRRSAPRKAAQSKLHEALVERRIAELRDEMARGGLREALVRALIWVGMARNAVDERGFAAITRLRDAHPRQPADVARRLQGAGARAVPDARRRRGGGARRHPRADAGAGRRAPRGLRRATGRDRGERRPGRRPGRAPAPGRGALRPRPRAA